jgi:chemotaxis protein MotA
MIVSGNNNPSHIDTVMSQEIEVLDKEAREPSNSLLAIADSLPAFGIVAAITGVIHTLSELQDVTEASDIGIGMAAALVGTLLGVFMSYAVVGPVASTLKQLADAELRPFESVREIVVAYYSGFAPLVAVEYGRKVLFSDQRPTMDELENSVMATSGQPFRDR